jgi:lipoprotein NlpI
MATGENVLREDHVVAFPPTPTAGMLGVLIRESRVDEFRRLERENRARIWRVRGVVSDHIPVLRKKSIHREFIVANSQETHSCSSQHTRGMLPAL